MRTLDCIARCGLLAFVFAGCHRVHELRFRLVVANLAFSPTPEPASEESEGAMAAAVDSASEPEPDGPPVNWTPEELGDPTVRLAPTPLAT